MVLSERKQLGKKSDSEQ